MTATVISQHYREPTRQFVTVASHCCLEWYTARYSTVDTMVEIGPRNQIYLAAQNNPKNTNDFTDKSTGQTRVLAIGLKGRKTALT